MKLLKKLSKMSNQKKKLKPLCTYVCDITLETFEMRIQARSIADARKKMKAKLKKMTALSQLNRKQTFIDKW